VFSSQEAQALLNACARRRDRLLVGLLYESGMRIGQALGLRHADIRSFDGEIDIVPRANSHSALAKSRSPYTVHVSKELMALYADYLVHEHKDVSHDYVFVNWWSGRITRLQSLSRFSEFLEQERPRATAKAITRKLLEEYLSYLPKRVGIAVRKNDVINVRTFLEIAARERWLPIGPERMIYDEEVARSYHPFT
jgi:integrase